MTVQIVGAFFYDGQWDVFPVGANPERIWNWRDTQILRSLKSGLAPTLWPEIVRILKGLALIGGH